LTTFELSIIFRHYSHVTFSAHNIAIKRYLDKKDNFEPHVSMTNQVKL